MFDTSQVYQHSSQPTHGTPLLWTHVVNNKRKGNNKTQQSIVSFNPTLINRPVTDTESSRRSNNGVTSPGPIAVIRPFLKDIEQDSVFIDLTPVKDRNLLNKALLKFNEASNADDMYEDFLGYRSKPHHYLGHAFLETITLGFDILVLQETHATDTTIIDTFNIQFNSKPSLWTHDCSIISLNRNYTLQHISDGIDEGRFILASLHLTRDLEHSPTTPPIATVLNIYGRSSTHSERSAFYSELMDTPIVRDTITSTTSTTSTTFIMGDFNYQCKNQRLDGILISAPVEWTDMLDDYFIDVFGNDKHNTWHSGRNAAILDYVYCSSNAHHLVTSTSQQYLSPEWTDHELLGFSFQFHDVNGRGPGAWKANPFLARSKTFRKALAEFLIGSEERLAVVKSFSTPQQQWDWIKAEVKLFIKQYQVEDLN